MTDMREMPDNNETRIDLYKYFVIRIDTALQERIEQVDALRPQIELAKKERDTIADSV